MKKNIIFILLVCVFTLPICLTNSHAEQTKMGLLYEFIIDPMIPDNVSEYNSVCKWFANNFDENCIPLVSIQKINNSGTNSLFGLDSVYKRYPIEIQARRLFWEPALPDISTGLVVTWPYFSDDPIGVTSATGKANTLASIKAAIDENENIKTPLPISVTSRIEGGNYIIDIVAPFDESLLEEESSYSFWFNVVLAEAYHAYGTGTNKQESYFSPRVLCTGTNGTLVTFSSTNKTWKKTYTVPIDKSWNTKYLYAAAWAQLNGRMQDDNGTVHNISMAHTIDAASDRVVNIKNATTATPVKLNISMAAAADTLKKIVPPAKTILSYKVTNPTNSQIKAEFYINPATSYIPDGWTYTLDRTTATIPPGSSATVNLTVNSPELLAGACGFDFCALPIDTKDDENPIISSRLAVLADKDLKAIVFSDRENQVENYSYSVAIGASPYIEELGLLGTEYHAVVPPNAFEGYFYNNATRLEQGDILALQGAANYLIPGTYNTNWSSKENNIMAKHLAESEVDFINNALTSGKHVALFTDKSAWYANSDVAPSAEKVKFAQMFTRFGVSLGADITRYNGDPVFRPEEFTIKTNTADPIGKDQNNEAYILNMNAYSAKNTPASSIYTNKWQVINPSQSSVVAYYEPDITSNAIVSTTNGNQKLLIAGFGINGVTGSSSFVNLFNNTMSWWFGHKEILAPNMQITNSQGSAINTLNFNEPVMVTNSVTGKVYVENLENASGILRLYKYTLSGNDDDAVKILYFPQKQIEPGEQDSIIIEFAPKYKKNYNVTIDISCNDPKYNYEYSLYVTGIGDKPEQGIGPIMTVSEIDGPQDNYHNFGKKEANSGSYEHYINIYNEGDEDLEVTISLNTNAPAGIFTLKNNNFTVVKPGDTGGTDGKDFAVVFTPKGESVSYSATLVIKGNDDNNPEVKIDFDAEVETDGSVLEKTSKISSCSVSPNPASGIACIKFNILANEPKNTKITLVDMSGRTIQQLTNKIYSPGEYTNYFNVSNLPAGNYFININIDEEHEAVPFKIIN